MSYQDWLAAFDDAAALLEKAEGLADHRTIEVEDSPTVTVEDDQGRATVTVTDAEVASLWLSDDWLAEAESDEIADVVKSLVNQAYREWTAAQLAEVGQVLPDIAEFNQAVAKVRKQFGEAWVETLAKARSDE